MATLYNGRHRTDNDPWHYGGSAPPAPVTPVYQTALYATSRGSTYPHPYDNRGSDGADKDKGDEGRQDDDAESDDDPRHRPRRAPVTKSTDQGYPLLNNARLPLSMPRDRQKIIDGKPKAGATTRSNPIPTNRHGETKAKEEDDSGSDDSDGDIQSIDFFVPGENINAAVLVEYINRYVDRTAKITSAQHPSDKTRVGFNIHAKRALNSLSIRDVINDSRDWDYETKSREYRKDPYDYRESDTARRRAKKGPAPGGTNRPQQPRK